MFRNFKNGVAVVDIADSSLDAFKCMLDLLYVGEEVLTHCNDWGLLFEIFKVSDQYDVKVENFNSNCSM